MLRNIFPHTSMSYWPKATYLNIISRPVGYGVNHPHFLGKNWYSTLIFVSDLLAYHLYLIQNKLTALTITVKGELYQRQAEAHSHRGSTIRCRAQSMSKYG